MFGQVKRLIEYSIALCETTKPHGHWDRAALLCLPFVHRVAAEIVTVARLLVLSPLMMR